MRLQIRNRITMLKAGVVAEGTPSQPGRRAWLMLQWVQDGVQLVEAETPDDVDPDEYLSPEQVLSRQVTHFVSLDAAIDSLRERGVDTAAFEVPWKTECPF